MQECLAKHPRVNMHFALTSWRERSTRYRHRHQRRSAQHPGLFPLDDVHASLRLFGLADGAPLTAMAVEFFIAPEVPDPLGTDLGQARMLRASPLVPVPIAC